MISPGHRNGFGFQSVRCELALVCGVGDVLCARQTVATWHNCAKVQSIVSDAAIAHVHVRVDENASGAALAVGRYAFTATGGDAAGNWGQPAVHEFWYVGAGAASSGVADLPLAPVSQDESGIDVLDAAWVLGRLTVTFAAQRSPLLHASFVCATAHPPTWADAGNFSSCQRCAMHSLTHSLFHTLTHSLHRSLKHSFTHSLAHSLAHPLLQPAHDCF